MHLQPGSGDSATEVSLETGCLTMAHREDIRAHVERLYEENYEPVYRYLYLSGCTPTDADEFIQEAFLRMFEALRGGNKIEKPRNWLLRVTHNLSCDERRHVARRDNFEEDKLPLRQVTDPTPNPEIRMVRQEQLLALRTALAQLTDRQSRFLLLRAEGLKLREIAELYGVTVQSVAESCERAINRLGRLTHE